MTRKMDSRFHGNDEVIFSPSSDAFETTSPHLSQFELAPEVSATHQNETVR